METDLIEGVLPDRILKSLYGEHTAVCTLAQLSQAVGYASVQTSLRLRFRFLYSASDSTTLKLARDALKRIEEGTRTRVVDANRQLDLEETV